MFSRRPLSLPITLGIVMIVLLVMLIVGWVLLSVFGALADERRAVFYWTFLTVGSIIFVVLLVGVVVYLSLSIKAINLSRRQSNFIDSVTHELKSPIASLKLYLQTLNRRRVSLEEQQEFNRFMLEDVERLDHLINQLLDAARLERPAVENDLAEIELSALLREAAASVCLRYRAPEDLVEFDLEPCAVQGREGDLAMVFRNLIDNAVKYADADPRVWVSLRCDGDGWATVRIVDNGPGVPPKMRRKIFGRFVRLGLELEREKPGTGLGLHIVHTLVIRMRGRIRVRSRPERTGAVFEVQLPDARPAASADARAPGQSLDRAKLA